MDTDTKALIVEDAEIWQGICRRNLENVVKQIDVAPNLQEGIELITKRYYHLAIIDLSLDPDDPNNRDGMVLLKKLRLLRDETSSVVLSATGKMEDGANALREGALEVIEKATFNNSRFVEISQELASKAVKNRKIGGSKGIQAFLAAQEDQYLIYKMQNVIFGPGEGGYKELNTLVSTLIDDYFPIWKLGSRDFLQINEGSREINITGWSRFKGYPFLLKIARAEVVDKEAENFKQEKDRNKKIINLETIKKQGAIGGLIFSLANYNINDFEIPNFLLNF